jgi:predicted DNA repair protein MutK
MASSLLVLLDDIASVLDDVAILTKVAARKTAAVLGDDLAVNAEQVSGVRAMRELPVVWAVFKGSLVNKLILVPAALLISFIAPWAITPLLMVGGLFLCYEGIEKLLHKRLHPEDDAHRAQLSKALQDPKLDLKALEKQKIKGAIRTDFILSAEIVAITLGIVADAAFATQVAVLAGIALLMTVGVYGLVGAIVKLDDAGLYLSQRAGQGAWLDSQRALGRGLLLAAPYLMKLLSVAGMIAMFLVGGGILVHGIPALHHGVLQLSEIMHAVPTSATLVPLLANALIGLLAGALVLLVLTGVQRIRGSGAA